MLELLVAMLVVAVALMALVTALASGVLAIRKASRTSVGAALAGQELDFYRSRAFAAVGLSATSTDATYLSRHPAGQADAAVVTCADPRCAPIQTGVRGTDGLAYRIDTYVTVPTSPAPGRTLKQVTVVVRDDRS